MAKLGLARAIIYRMPAEEETRILCRVNEEKAATGEEEKRRKMACARRENERRPRLPSAVSLRKSAEKKYHLSTAVFDAPSRPDATCTGAATAFSSENRGAKTPAS